jgi:hypothetical protein
MITIVIVHLLFIFTPGAVSRAGKEFNHPAHPIKVIPGKVAFSLNFLRQAPPTLLPSPRL